MASGGKFDYREVEKLQKQIEQMDRDGEAFCRDCARELAERLLSNVVKQSPVEQVPNIQGAKVDMAKGGARQQPFWEKYQRGALGKNWTVGEIKKAGDTYTIEVLNPTEYTSHVEYGYWQEPELYMTALGRRPKKTWVPGQFMMTISEKELKSVTPKLLEKKLEDFVRRYRNAE